MLDIVCICPVCLELLAIKAVVPRIVKNSMHDWVGGGVNSTQFQSSESISSLSGSPGFYLTTELLHPGKWPHSHWYFFFKIQSVSHKEYCAFFKFLKVSWGCCSLPTGSFLPTFMDWNFVCNSYIEIFCLLGCYAACIASWPSTFWDNLPFPPSGVKQDSGGKNNHSILRKVPKKSQISLHSWLHISSKASSFPDGKPTLW